MSKIKTSEINLFLVLFLASLTLVFFDNLGFLKPARSVLQVVSTPLDYSLFRAGQAVEREIKTVWELRGIYKKYLAVQEALSLAQAEIARFSEVERENQLLLSQIGVKQTQEWDLILANIIGLNRYLKIDKGEKAGVTYGMAVAYKNILVGKVVDISPFGANVQLTSDPEFKIPAKVEGEEESKGLLSGRFRKGAVLEKILPERKLKKGDLVVTAGSESIPPNLLIGTVYEVEEAGPSPFQEAQVALAINSDFLQMVFVLKRHEF